MAFLNDLGRTLSQVGQTAVQKTKEMTDVARLNGMIFDEEKKINNNYYEIGKLYVVMHKSDFENDFREMIMAVQESKAKIVDYKQQIQNIKGVLYCEKCGAEVASDVAFCNACGAPVSKQTQMNVENENFIKCTACGVMVDKKMHFCTSCGTALADVAETKDETMTDVNQSDTEMLTIKCANCGMEVDKGSVFCTECGGKLE